LEIGLKFEKRGGSGDFTSVAHKYDIGMVIVAGCWDEIVYKGGQGNGKEREGS